MDLTSIVRELRYHPRLITATVQVVDLHGGDGIRVSNQDNVVVALFEPGQI